MSQAAPEVDLLCIGHACYDLVFAVDHHPEPDEKARASAFVSCGGGTAANAAVAAARLGAGVAFAGYLGDDLYGDQHLAELHDAGVATELVKRGAAWTPISAIFVKPDGRRSIVNYKGDTNSLGPGDVNLAALRPKAFLLDGHQPALAHAALQYARALNAPVVLDADTMNAGNVDLVRGADYVVASERFAHEYTGEQALPTALARLAALAPVAVVTLGERGLVWRRGDEIGALPAFPVHVVDTTGAGDAFHGAFAAGVAAGMPWPELLRFASAAGALCCTKQGARLGIPRRDEVDALLVAHPLHC